MAVSPRAPASAHGARFPNHRNNARVGLTSLLVVLLLASLLHASAASCSSSSDALFPTESFDETLLLKPLPDGRILSSFTFRLASTSSSTSSFRLLPRALLQPIQHFGVSEVHLSLNSGRWRYKSWGSPVTTLNDRVDYHHAQPEPGAVRLGDTVHTKASGTGKVRLGEESVGAGAELWARFDRRDKREPSGQRWKGLTSALAGLFCTSLDALDERQTVQPHYAYSSSTSSSSAAAFNTSQVVHALLPTENVCTENLTPFLKLLPCKHSAGLASLLNPLSLFGANFHGLAVHVTRTHPTPGVVDTGGWEVDLTFTAVFAPAVTRDISIRDWSISSLFGRPLETACPLADRSLVRVLKPNDPEGSAKYQVTPLPAFPPCSVPGDRACAKGAKGTKEFFPILAEEDQVTDELAAADLLAWETDQEEQEYQERLQKRWGHYLDSVDGEYLYNVPAVLAQGRLDVRMSWPHETRFTYPAAVGNVTGGTGQGVHVERTLIGAGQQRTTLQVVLTNPDERLAQRVLWYETLGYFVKPYLHTLQHQVSLLPSTSALVQDELLRSIADFESPLEQVTYQPTTMRSDDAEGSASMAHSGDARRGTRPFVLEAVVRIPAHASVTLQIELRKQFVPYSQHPPDAHRGFDLNPAIIFPLAPVDPRESLVAKQSKSRLRHKQNRAASTLDPPPPSSTWQRLLRTLLSTEVHANHRRSMRSEPGRAVAKHISKTQTRIYTLPRLVELATPDFSFVYTNIIFTSTVVALFFGSTLNTLLRTFTDFVI